MMSVARLTSEPSPVQSAVASMGNYLLGHPIANSNFRNSALVSHPFVIKILLFEPSFDSHLEYGLIPLLFHGRDFITIPGKDKATSISVGDMKYLLEDGMEMTGNEFLKGTTGFQGFAGQFCMILQR